MIKLENVTKIYNNDGILTTGLHNVSLEFTRNEIVAITGESGSGKSTLLNVLTKIDSFDEGEYYYRGNETSYFDIDDMDDFRKNKVGFIFQNYNIVDSYSVLENVMLPLRIKGFNHKDAKAKAMELIRKVGLGKRYRNRGIQLSGGEKQRCIIARALAADCDILACDEPTGNLDSQTSEEIIALIKEVAKDKLVLIVTHSFEQVKDIATRKIKIHNGEVVEDIIYESREQDESIPLDLDYKKLKMKIKIDTALNNLVHTPKKTILSILLIVFVCFFALCLYQYIYYSQVNMDYTNMFGYVGNEKLLVYNARGDRKIDIEKIKELTSTYSINDFDSTNNIVNILESNSQIAFCYEKHPKNLQLDEGRMPLTDTECILLIPSNEKVSNMLNRKIEFNDMHGLPVTENSCELTIVGYQYRDDVKKYVITENLLFEKFSKISYTLLSGSKYYTFSYTAKNDYIEEYMRSDIIEILYDYSLDTSFISLNNNYCNTDLQFDFTFTKNFAYKKYEFNFDFNDLELKYNNTGKNYVYLGNDFFEAITETPYEASIYVDNIERAQRKIEKMGYSYVHPRTYIFGSKLDHYITNLWAIISMIIFSFVIVIIYLISYIILSKIYESKKKDYAIFRTLGISKRDMKDIVLIEIMSQVVVISIVVYFATFIAKQFTTQGLMEIFTEFSSFAGVMYFIVISLFGYLIARRFNKNLFKFSVNTTLKGDLGRK